MTSFPLVKAVPLSIRSHAVLDERWVQDRIADDPAMLGLGDVYLKDKERMQPRAGRLDLLLQGTEDDRRYEVEVQLGPTDEAHIIRCIEYWDIERRRYPQYDHCPVLVAEDVTSRFLNIISLLNGQIPLIAIQMKAYEVAGGVMLTFTRILDELRLGPVDDDEITAERVDRKYWEGRAEPHVLALIDRLYLMARSVAPGLQPTYLKHHMGSSLNGKVVNFITMSPKSGHVTMSFRLPQSADTEKAIEDAGIDMLGYKRYGAYRIRVTATDVEKSAILLTDLMRQAYTHFAV